MLSFVGVRETAAQPLRLDLQFRQQTRDLVRPEANRGAGNGERCDDLPAGPADRYRHRRQAGLEFVDRDRVPGPSDRAQLALELAALEHRRRAGRAQRPGGQHGRAVREEDLADRGAVVVDAPPDPLPGAQEVMTVDLGEVLDGADAGDGEVHGLIGRRDERIQGGPGELRERALEEAASGVREDRRSGAQQPARPVLRDQTVAGQHGQQARRRALGQLGGSRQIRDADRMVAREHSEQQLRTALDRLRAGHLGLEQLFHGDIY